LSLTACCRFAYPSWKYFPHDVCARVDEVIVYSHRASSWEFLGRGTPCDWTPRLMVIGRADPASMVVPPRRAASPLSGQFCHGKPVMRAFIRQFRSQKSQVEPPNTVEGPAETSRPVPTSDLGIRVVKPYRVNAAIE